MEMEEIDAIELQAPVKYETFQGFEIAELWKAYWKAEMEEFLARQNKGTK